MTHPDSSDDHQRPEVIHPALPRQADGPPPKAAAQLAASGPGFKIAAAFQAEQSQRLDGYPRWASGLPLFPAARADLVFQQAISKMAASPDLGLLKVNHQLIRSAAVAMAAPHHDLLRNIGNFATSITTLSIPVNFTGMGAVASLVDLFLRWREAAESGLGVLRGLARAAFSAALRARAAILHGDDGLVAWFIETWLGLRVSPERIEAVSAALLEEGWDASVPDDPAHLLTDLRRRTARQARFLRPIWETQLNHRTIGMLDQPVITGNGTLLAVADLIPGGQATDHPAPAQRPDPQTPHPPAST